MEYIYVTNEARKELERIFGVTRQAVYLALNFKSDSDLSKKIRNVAVSQKGGRVIRELDITDGWCPNCETEFQHVDGKVERVVSTFSNNVQVVLDCYKDMATITMNGEEVRRYWNVGGTGWGNVLYTAEQLSIQ